MDRFIEILREEFEKATSSKTGWGKNEMMMEFDKACIRALARYAVEKGISLV